MIYHKVQNPAGFLSASPLPSAEELAKFYAESYYQVAVSTSYSTAYDETELAYKRLKADALVALASEHTTLRDTFLDIGAGEGFLIDAALRGGYDCVGADFSTHGINSFHPMLVDRLVAGDVFDFLEEARAAGRKFGVCSAINVLEHVIDPTRFLRLVRELMTDSGVALITVPNDYSDLQTKLMESGAVDREYWFAPPQHLHYFNTENLAAYCRAEGFEVRDLVADFPIDLMLLNPATNYIANPDVGKAAHRTRMEADLLIAERGLASYLAYYRGMAGVGLGRDITIVVSKAP